MASGRLATLTGIFSGRITMWDAREIAADNVGVRLPHGRIRPIHRSDDSGTTHNFTSYLQAAGRWPYPPSRKWAGAGRGVAGSAGVTHLVQYVEGSIGYVEYGFASNARLRTAKVRNAAGRFTALSPQSATEALEGVRMAGDHDDLVVEFDYLTKAKGAYPIILVTYEITCSNNADPLVRTFLSYTASDAGQSYLPCTATPRSRRTFSSMYAPYSAIQAETTQGESPRGSAETWCAPSSMDVQVHPGDSSGTSATTAPCPAAPSANQPAASIAPKRHRLISRIVQAPCRAGASAGAQPEGLSICEPCPFLQALAV